VDIVLVEPEIPQNTGNIARTCAALGCNLHLVRPLGFDVSDKFLKRAGLDYWHLVNVQYYDSFEEVQEKNKNGKFYFLTTKALNRYDQVEYDFDNTFLVFGKETAGLPEELLVKNRDNCVRIPMISDARSLNLSNSVAIVAYEVARQHKFLNLQAVGELHRLSW
jgi:tRNA (cytidine/uridine-2'-O-)-methyltransferase